MGEVLKKAATSPERSATDTGNLCLMSVRNR
jgi:hypothetical protein